MAVPDTIELSLGNFRSAENRDRVTHIEMLLKQILFSPEVTPSADETGEWPMDFVWELTPDTKVTLRKRSHETRREWIGRMMKRNEAAGKVG